MMKKITFFWFLILITSFSASAKEVFIEPSNNSHEEVQTALIELSPGDVLTLSPGTFVFEDGMRLDNISFLLLVFAGLPKRDD